MLVNTRSLLEGYGIPVAGKEKGNPTSEFSEQIGNVMSLMNEDASDSKRFRYWCGRLRKFRKRPSEIYSLIRRAEEGENPPALFNWLLRNNK